MIDIDLLDRQLEEALTEEVRLLRGSSSAWTTSGTAQPGGTAWAGAPTGPAHPAADQAPWVLDDTAWAADRAAPASVAPASSPQASPPSPPSAPGHTASHRTAADRTAPGGTAPPRPSGDGRRPAPASPGRDRAGGRRDQRPSTPSPAPGTASGSPRDRLRLAAAVLAGAGDDTEPQITELARRIPAVLATGDMAEVDRLLAAHAALARDEGRAADRADAAAWATMRALMAGRPVTLAAPWSGGAEAERAWAQRFWAAIEYGTASEREELLDHCRERAYRHGDQAWRAWLALLLARLGRLDEAGRELAGTLGAHGLRLDAVAALAEVAFLTGARDQAAALGHSLSATAAQLVVVGPGWACAGAVERARAHVAVARGRAAEADRHFAQAVEVHRRTGALPLLARTLDEWAAALEGRDEARARNCREEAATVRAGQPS